MIPNEVFLSDLSDKKYPHPDGIKEPCVVLVS